MQPTPTYSPTSIRPPSIDSLCMPDDENVSLNGAQEISPSSSTTAAAGVLHENPVRDSIVLPPASDSTTKLVATGPAFPVHPSNTHFWKTSFFRDRWLWETTCILFSIACIVAITILSSLLDGTWLSKWTFFLQPSTTFSVLITAAQSSMMLVIAEVLSQLKWLQLSLPKAHSVADFATFDSASRGPLGSLRILFRWKPGSKVLSPMVYAASLITIATLAMGPFIQQVINIQANNSVPTDGVNSTITVSNYYDYPLRQTGAPLFLAENGTIYKTTNEVVFDVDPDFQGSFYNGYYTLGKSSIDFSCPSSNCSWDVFNSLGICSTCQNVTEASRRIFEYSLDTLLTPGGWSITLDSLTQVVTKTNDFFTGSTLDALSAELVHMAVVQRPSHLPNHDYVITECSISWCAKQYINVTVINGTLQQHHSIREVPLWPVAGQDFGGLIRGIGSFDNWALLLTPGTGRENISTPLPPFDHGGFNVSVWDHMALSDYLVSELNFKSESSTALFGDGQNVTSILLNITDSVTTSIMRWKPETAARGIVWRQEPSVKVQWEWLALPLALVVFSAILLVSVVVASRHYNAPHWKSSPLPFLFHGIRDWNDDEELELVEGRLEKVHVMEDRARIKRVRIVESLKGGRWLAE